MRRARVIAMVLVLTFVGLVAGVAYLAIDLGSQLSSAQNSLQAQQDKLHQLASGNHHLAATADWRSKTLVRYLQGRANANNLTIKFVAPASGSVIVRLQAYAAVTNATAYQNWYLVNHGTTAIVGVPQNALGQAASATITVDYLITGLIPGNAYQYDWAAAASAASSSIIFAGPGTGGHTYGAAVMEVLAA